MLRCERPICVSRVRLSMMIFDDDWQSPQTQRARSGSSKPKGMWREGIQYHTSPTQQTQHATNSLRYRRRNRKNSQDWKMLRKRDVFLHVASPARMSNSCTCAQTIDGKVQQVKALIMHAQRFCGLTAGEGLLLPSPPNHLFH